MTILALSIILIIVLTHLMRWLDGILKLQGGWDEMEII